MKILQNNFTLELFTSFLSEWLILCKIFEIYPKKHSEIKSSLEKSFDLLIKSINQINNDLFIFFRENDCFISKCLINIGSSYKLLFDIINKKGIDSIIIKKNITFSEWQKFNELLTGQQEFKITDELIRNNNINNIDVNKLNYVFSKKDKVSSIKEILKYGNSEKSKFKFYSEINGLKKESISLVETRKKLINQLDLLSKKLIKIKKSDLGFSEEDFLQIIRDDLFRLEYGGYNNALDKICEISLKAISINEVLNNIFDIMERPLSLILGGFFSLNSKKTCLKIYEKCQKTFIKKVFKTVQSKISYNLDFKDIIYLQADSQSFISDNIGINKFKDIIVLPVDFDSEPLGYLFFVSKISFTRLV